MLMKCYNLAKSISIYVCHCLQDLIVAAEYPAVVLDILHITRMLRHLLFKIPITIILIIDINCLTCGNTSGIYCFL
jgi:hypothetical protein